jgi:SAM-dependent methyltransferase
LTNGTNLERAYRLRFQGGEERRQRVWAVLGRYFSQRWIRPGDTVVDLGAGYCEFLNSIQAAKRYAIDANPDTRARAAKGVEVLSQDAAEPWGLDSGCVDVVFTSNFLEHATGKEAVVRILEEAYRVLRPEGRFVALGPNIRVCYDVYWDYFDHHVPLSDRSLVEALEIAGFQTEMVAPRFLPYTMRGDTGASVPLGIYLLLLRLYLAFPPLWRLFGKQFLVVARKPHGSWIAD